jgi:hypothetical protein
MKVPCLARARVCAALALACAAALSLPAAASAGITPISHFVCYGAIASPNATVPKPYPQKANAARLQDQVDDRLNTGGRFVSITTLNQHCNPADKTIPGKGTTLRQNPDAHLQCFKAMPNPSDHPDAPPPAVVQADFTNQFGTSRIQYGPLKLLCLPTWKNLTAPDFQPPRQPPNLDHFDCYTAVRVAGAPQFLRPPTLSTTDQFGTINGAIKTPSLICNPVRKQIFPGTTTPGLLDPTQHLVCFPYIPSTTPTFLPKTGFAKNQFGIGRFTARSVATLCVPSTKSALIVNGGG